MPVFLSKCFSLFYISFLADKLVICYFQAASMSEIPDDNDRNILETDKQVWFFFVVLINKKQYNPQCLLYMYTV